MEDDAETASPLLRKFFENFISEELEKNDISVEYLTLLKIILFDFDEIVTTTGKSGNYRKKYILEIIEKYLVDDKFRKKIDSIKLPKTNDFIESQGSETPQIKLKQIDLVNFRGFRTNLNGAGRKISFDGKTSLFFAPNGGGKTSLCEALEWVLTGDTLEHTQRNIEPDNKYFQNRDVCEPSYKNTKLYMFDGFNSEIPNTVFDRCFLEKNRIEKFAKIAIQRGVDVQRILGELFGLTEIVDFFSEFVQDLSPTDTEKNEKEKLQIWLDWDVKKRDLEKNIQESKREENETSKNLKKQTGNKNYEEKEKEVEGKVEKLSKELKSLDNDRSIYFSNENFQVDIKDFLEKARQWKEYKEKISKNAGSLDFEILYQTASKIFQDNKDISKCPLCDTPIKPGDGLLSGHKCVVTDPREKTKAELKKLEALTELKRNKLDLESDIKRVFVNIKDEWAKIQHNLKDENWIEISNNTSKPELPNIDLGQIETIMYDDFGKFVVRCKTSLSKDFSKVDIVEKYVSTYKLNRQELLKKKQEREENIRNLKKLQGELQQLHLTFLNKKAIREKSESRMEDLKKQSGNSALFKKLLGEYNGFYLSFQNFQSSVILAEAKDIDGLVTGFYRALNFYDHDGELVKNISFPKKVQGDFCLTYEKGENNERNALQVLSEGHLRTLGLASLLARAAKLNTLLLVFDDAINAIDSDHRDNIAHLLAGKFTDEQGEFAFQDKWKLIKDYLSRCQFIITSHDRFFDEKLANLFDKENQIRYVLYCGQNGIDFCEKGVPANFEEKIGNYLNSDTQDIRSAIFYCRIWLEEILLEKIINYKDEQGKPFVFKKIGVDKQTRSLKYPAFEIVISELIDVLKKSGNGDKKMVELLENILKEKEGKYIWFFQILNQESHYRRFDHVDISNAPTSKEVETIFKNIQKIHELNSHNQYVSILQPKPNKKSL